MIDRSFIDNLPRLIESRMKGYGLGRNLSLRARDACPSESTEIVTLKKSTIGFKGSSDESGRLSEILTQYCPESEGPTFHRLANLLAYGRQARDELKVGTEDLRAYQKILAKGEIKGYVPDKDRMNLGVGRIEIIHSVRDSDAKLEEIFNAFYNLGIRPLIAVTL